MDIAAREAPTVVVLCGGTSRRLGGMDKTRQLLGDSTVLGYLLGSLPDDWPLVCVGTERAVVRPVAWVREAPPGGGPVAGMAAGLAAFATTWCVVVAGDMPFAGVAVRGLLGAVRAAAVLDAAVAVGPDGRAQPLLAAYRAEALRAALPAQPDGARMMSLLDRLRWLPVDVSEVAALDVDTPEALQRARHIVGA